MFDGFLPSAVRGEPAHSTLFSAGGATGPTVINCGIGVVIVQGLPCTVGEGITVNCSVGQVTVAGLPCTIIAATYVSCSTGIVIVAGLPATITSVSLGSGFMSCAITYLNSDSAIPVYDLGDSVRVIATFTDDVTGALVTPSALQFRLRQPTGAISTSIVPILDSVGVYHVDLTASIGGVWRFTWLATGVAEDGEFVVTTSLSD